MSKQKPEKLKQPGDKPAEKTAESASPRVPKRDKESDAIRQFLSERSPFEAEAIRIMIAASASENPEQALCDADEFMLNCCLNVGFKKSADCCTEALIAHRQSRVVPVADLAAPFLDKGQILPAVGMLLQLATNEKSVSAFLKRIKGTPLASMPDASPAKPKPKKDDKGPEDDTQAEPEPQCETPPSGAGEPPASEPQQSC